MLYSHFSAKPFRLLVPGAIWEMDEKAKVIYLTFDDGPNKEITAWILEILNQFDAKATFFLVGKNIERYPDLLEQIIVNRHLIANHSMHHRNNLTLSLNEFKSDVFKCNELLESFNSDIVKSTFYRPPYGRIRLDQLYVLNKTHQVIMWSYLSGDFDPKLDLRIAKTYWNKIKSGTIAVFHDNPKHFERLTKILPDFLAYFTEIGVRFQTLPSQF